MDQQKTGALIAQRRKEMNLTQKELAEIVGVSDRAISKWERGVGFPDVSLLEPLADALGVTLQELFQGKRCPPSPADEASARTVLRLTLPAIRKYRTIAVILCALLILTLACWLIPTAGNRWIPTDSVTTAEQAVAIAPEILITKADYDLINSILSDPELGRYYIPYPLGQEITPYTLENEGARAFSNYFRNDLLYAGIAIHGNQITVSYSSDTRYVTLMYHPDKITKEVVLSEHPVWDDEGHLLPMGHRHGNRIDLLNENNEAFYQGGYSTGWLEHFRTTFY